MPDDVEKTKKVTRASTEGSGIYSCTAAIHADNFFTTRSKEDFEKHIKEPGHYSQGSDLCAICNEPVDMNVVITRAGHKPMHPECRQAPEEL